MCPCRVFLVAFSLALAAFLFWRSSREQKELALGSGEQEPFCSGEDSEDSDAEEDDQCSRSGHSAGGAARQTEVRRATCTRAPRGATCTARKSSKWLGCPRSRSSRVPVVGAKLESLARARVRLASRRSARCGATFAGRAHTAKTERSPLPVGLRHRHVPAQAGARGVAAAQPAQQQRCQEPLRLEVLLLLISLHPQSSICTSNVIPWRARIAAAARRASSRLLAPEPVPTPAPLAPRFI